MTGHTPPAPTRTLTQKLHHHIRNDPDSLFAATVCLILGSIAFAGSATHILHVGAYPHVNVTGWLVWSVAGSLEALAAYAAWEARRRHGWNRVIPILVLLASLAFIVLANLAAADAHAWAARLPWADAFAVVPPLAFLSVAAIAESRSWKRAGSPRAAKTPRAGKPSAEPRKPKQEGDSQNAGQKKQITGGAPSEGTSLRQPTVLPGEDRAAAVERWLREGHRWKAMIGAGMEHFAVGQTAMKNEIRRARTRTAPEVAGS
ncbi:hypothetical protein [Kineosporia babensis]|uniref:DUF2637 domain-containing protein n=1 Tax=Kineosporia babensis TaxID=499548 RepID=A0A9X1NKS1_9ACTN|nr:hypothetical protein [Kineosporia babensis]MCD5316822.1 hypothetical protein [Kineosporia babensis]